MTNLTKRSLLQGALAAGGGLMINGMPLRLTMAQDAVTLTGVTYLTPTYEGLLGGINGFVEKLKEAGGDSVTIDFYDSGTLLKADEQTSALRSGAIDFMVHTTSYITRSFEILGITGLPSLVTDLYEHGERLNRGTPLFELINQELAKSDLYMLTSGGGVMEPEYVWSSDSAPVRSLDDLNGKKVRVVSYEASAALEGYGVASVRIPSSEAYLALQRGTVDAFVGNISTVLARKLEEQLSTCYKLPITAYAQSIFLLNGTWEAMDEPVKAAFIEAADWFDQNFAKSVNLDVYPNTYWPRIEEAGIEIIEPSEGDLERFAKTAEEIWAWWKEQVGEEVGQQAIDYARGAA
jgi:TRAP-type C4-dicarboxylate transport system substrate-binding protein